MRAIFTLLLSFVLLAVALFTGAILLIGLAAVVTVFVIYATIRQKLTGRPVSTMRVYSMRETSTPKATIIDAQFKEIEKE